MKIARLGRCLSQRYTELSCRRLRAACAHLAGLRHGARVAAPVRSRVKPPARRDRAHQARGAPKAHSDLMHRRTDVSARLIATCLRRTFSPRSRTASAAHTICSHHSAARASRRSSRTRLDRRRAPAAAAAVPAVVGSACEAFVVAAVGMSPRAFPEQRPRSQGHCLAAAAGRLGIEPTVVMPVRTPLARRSAIARAGAKVIIIHSDSAD